MRWRQEEKICSTGKAIQVDIQLPGDVKSIEELELFVESKENEGQVLRVVPSNGDEVSIPLKFPIDVAGVSAKFLKRFTALVVSCPAASDDSGPSELRPPRRHPPAAAASPQIPGTDSPLPGSNPTAAPAPERASVPSMALSLDDDHEDGTGQGSGDESDDVSDEEVVPPPSASACGVNTTSGEARSNGQDHSSPIASHSAACRSSDEASMVLKEQGNSLVKAGDYAGAVQAYSAAIVLKPTSGIAALYTNRALCKMKLNDPVGALGDCDQCLQLDAANARAHERRGDALVLLGRRDEARLAFEKGLEIEPGHKGCTASLDSLDKSHKGTKAKAEAPQKKQAASSTSSFSFNASSSAAAPERTPPSVQPSGSSIERLAGAILGDDAPITIESRPGRGRCVVAKGNLSPGDLAMMTDPMSCVVHDKYTDTVCHCCFKVMEAGVPRVQCRGECGGVVYCSKECEVGGRESHEGECGVLLAWRQQAAASGTGAEGVRKTRGLRMFMRLAYACARDSASAGLAMELECGPGGEEEAERRFGSMADAVNRFLREGVRMPKRRLAGLIARSQRNVHGVVNLAGQHLAHGLYPSASFYNHSCRPNCVVSFRGPKLCVHVVEAVRAGEELTIAYVELYAPRAWRRQQLKDSKGFDCTCQRCSLPEGDVREAALVVGEDGVALRAREGWDKALLLFQEGEFAHSRTVLEQILTMARGGALGEQNWVVYDTHKLLVDVCMALDDKPALERHSRRALSCMQAHLPSAHPSQALMMQHLANALASKRDAASLTEAQELFERAEGVLKVCYGEGHEATRDAGERAAAARVLALRAEAAKS